MTPTKHNPLFRLMPSLTDVAFLLPLVFLFTGLRGVTTMLGDGDTGYHIRAGDWMLANGRVPTQDLFSFTKPTEPWFAWEWLWDVGAALLHQTFGMAGVVMFNLLLISAMTVLLFKMVYRRCGNPLLAIALTGAASIGASIHWLARPHLVTLLMVLVFFHLLHRAREKGGEFKTLLWLPLLTVLWTNLHGGFFVGIVLVGAYAGGELLGALLAGGLSIEERIARAKKALPYIYTAVACALASLVNPYTYHLHRHILSYLRDPFQMRMIQEFMGTNFQWPSTRFLEVMIVLGVAAAVWYARRGRYAEVLLLAGWAHLALVSVRNVPIFMLIAAPVIAAPCAAWLKALSNAPVAAWLRSAAETFREIGDEMDVLERPWRLHAVSAAVIVMLALAMTSASAGDKLKPVYDPKAYPDKALAALEHMDSPAVLAQSRQASGLAALRIFTHDEWGDYLIYKLAPQGTKVFVDGRSDFYGGKFDQEYLDALNAKYTWSEMLARYGVDTILLPVDAPLVGALKETRHWTAVYDDGMAIVFRPASANLKTAGIEQFSTRVSGGIGGRGLAIAATTNVNPEGRVSKQQKGENP